MLHISKESKQRPEEILKAAVAHFGPDGVGLTIDQRNVGAIHFSGAGGYVLVQVAPLDDGAEVDVQTQEFEYDAKEFLQKV
ncbi:MAG: hypothetical protein R3C14_26825 [Caldilineaceae bacterium]